MKPMVYIAAPLFNPEQIDNIEVIEDMLTTYGFPFFSPKKETEGLLPSPENRKNPDAWIPLFKANVDGIRKSALIICVLSYPMNPGNELGILINRVADFEHSVSAASFKPLEFPDTGMVWEMGLAYGTGKLILGFHPNKKAEDLNVMLTQSCDGLISGWEKLRSFFRDIPTFDDSQPFNTPLSPNLRNRLNGFGPLQANSVNSVATLFNWEACENWTSQSGGVHD